MRKRSHGTHETQGGDGKKMRAVRRGRWGEALTVLYLWITAHRILARNFKTPMGEIDIIAKRAKRISFVEVKSRPTLTEGLNALTPHQCGRITRAAQSFLAQRSDLQNCDVRFDISVVTGPLRVHYRADAWQNEGQT